MSRSVLFWILMLAWLFFGGWFLWQHGASPAWDHIGYAAVPWCCIALLGWQTYGPAIKS